MIQKMLILFSALALLATSEQLYPAKEYKITGRVLDEQGQPLIGASIFVTKTTIVTVTDVDGKFDLNTQDSCSTLEIAYTGFGVQQIQACAGQPLEVRLKDDNSSLSEVVVTSKSSSRVSKHTFVSAPIISSMPRKPQMRSGTIQYDRKKVKTSHNDKEVESDERSEPFNTENYGKIEENRFRRPQQEPLSTFSIDVDAASYSNLRRMIEEGQLPPPDAVRIEEMINYFDYDYPQPKGDVPFSITSEVSACPWEPKHRLVSIGLQGKAIPTADLPASNLVFLIDVSGSMESADKLPLLISSFKLLVNQLRANDKIAIVVYAGAAGVVLPPTAGNEKENIIQALNKLEAGGSTAGGEGIELAYKLAKENFIPKGNNRVILATDGDFNVGVSSEGALVRMIEEKRKSGIFLTVMGFGTGNYQDDKMQQLADKGNGNHAYIDNLSEARKVLVKEFGGTLFTIAKDVKLQLEFNPAKVAGYRLIGYENRLLANEDFKDDTKDAGELGSGHTVTALYEIIPVGVESNFLADVDELKYQRRSDNNKAQNLGGILTVKFRYKAPDGDKSSLIEEVVYDRALPLERASDNFRWSAAVAEFGMLLRKSIFKGDATYSKCRLLADGARGKDEEGYRREMIKLLDLVGALDK